jgi:hypothetical protein
MRTATRAACVLAALLGPSACGDQILGVPASAQVSALEMEDLVEVCGEFVSVFCADTPPAPFEAVCNTCVVEQMCALPALPAEMTGECAGVTVGQVRDCAEGRTAGVCAEQTGGCMIDVAAALCPP